MGFSTKTILFLAFAEKQMQIPN